MPKGNEPQSTSKICKPDPNANPTSKVVVSLGIHRTDGGLTFKLNTNMDVSYRVLVCVRVCCIDGLAAECTSARLILPATMQAKVFMCVCV